MIRGFKNHTIGKMSATLKFSQRFAIRIKLQAKRNKSNSFLKVDKSVSLMVKYHRISLEEINIQAKIPFGMIKYHFQLIQCVAI